ncbi:MAG: lysophospholipid acyltransferase family protein [Robiginitomaculum sp.]|nr:lysophospholipid acyltransferase family protein [Robiginitomaculum sp.]
MMGKFFKHLVWRLEVLAYDFVRLLMLPFSLAQVSAFSGRLIGFIGPKTSKHHIAKTNMKLAFPDADNDQIEAWLAESWNRMGRTFGEFPLLGRIKVFDKNSNVEVVGLEILEKLKREKKGAVLISGHFANWELMAAVFSQAKLPVRVTYRPTNNPYFDKRIRAQRKAYGIELMVAKSGPKGAKELIRALRSGDSVALLNDQKFNEGIEIPFFGHGAMTAPGPTRLAMQTGAPIIPMSIVRTSGTNFRVTIHEEIKPANTGKRTADIRTTVIKITKFIEAQIREHPTDWFWVHRRWPKDMYRRK